MSRIAVIGGGITGLSACHYARRLIPSAQVSLFEKRSNYGGWIKTLQIPISSDLAIPLEIGPTSIRPANNEKTLITSQLINDLNLSNNIVAPTQDAKQRFIYHNNTIHDVKKLAFRCMIPAMIWIPYQQIYYYMRGGHENRYLDESIYDFFTRNFGQTVTNILASSFVNGVYGGGMNDLSIKSCSPFNMIKDMEIEYGSYFIGAMRGMLTRTKEKSNDSEDNNDHLMDTLSKMGSFTFQNGLQQIIDALVDTLSNDQNVELYNNCNVNAMSYSSDKQCVQLSVDENEFEFDYIINAVQPSHCASFLDSNSDLKQFNSSSSLILVNMLFKNKEFIQSINDKFKGFGILFPRQCDNINNFHYSNDNSLLGIIYYSSVYPFCAEDDVLSLVLMFGGPQFDTHSLTEKEIISLCKLKLMEIYDIDIDADNEKEISCDDNNISNPLEIFNINNKDYMDADIVYNINRLSKGIEHYKVGHKDKLQDLRNHLSKVYDNKVYLVGSGYDGVGIPDCIMSAYKSVNNIADIITKHSTKQCR